MSHGSDGADPRLGVEALRDLRGVEGMGSRVVLCEGGPGLPHHSGFVVVGGS